MVISIRYTLSLYGRVFIFKEEIGALILIRLMNNKWEGIALPKLLFQPIESSLIIIVIIK